MARPTSASDPVSAPRVANPARPVLVATVLLYVLQAVPLWATRPVQTVVVVLLSLGALVFGGALWLSVRAFPRGRGWVAVVAPLVAALAEVAWFALATGVWFASGEQARWALTWAFARVFWLAWAVGAIVLLLARRRR